MVLKSIYESLRGNDMAKCNHRCFECIHTDCINDDMSTVEIIESNQRDISLKGYGHILKGKHDRQRKRKYKR